VCRILGANTSIDQEHLSRYRKMVDRYFTYFMLRFEPNLVKTSDPIMAYPDKAFEDDPAKALRYK